MLKNENNMIINFFLSLPIYFFFSFDYDLLNMSRRLWGSVVKDKFQINLETIRGGGKIFVCFWNAKWKMWQNFLTDFLVLNFKEFDFFYKFIVFLILIKFYSKSAKIQFRKTLNMTCISKNKSYKTIFILNPNRSHAEER